jgi:hypothetical protein
MASMRSSLVLAPKVIGRRQFSLSQRRRLKDNWDQEALPGSNVPFNSNTILTCFDQLLTTFENCLLADNKWKLAVTMIGYVSSAVAVPFFAMRWQLLKKRAG